MYHLSLGYAQSDATAKNNDFNRLNIRFNTDVNMFKNFTTGIDFAYARNAYNLRDNGWAEDYTSKIFFTQCTRSVADAVYQSVCLLCEV